LRISALREASKARAGGGHLIWLGIHFLDMANYITGSHVVEATVRTFSIRKEYPTAEKKRNLPIENERSNSSAKLPLSRTLLMRIST